MSQLESTTPVNIQDEMRQSYMDYAMSVIVGRALPDVRDGLKPVHRRTLYAMHEMGLPHNRPYKKAARVVGDVMGKYHPHGDAAIYDTLVRMAQDFSMRYPLVDGQGNFGSVDGDPPAAMRYTEVRLAPIDQELLADIDRETVDFVPNYDETLQEPLVLPTRVPNLLVNGSSGIAVGMATNIPPHSLGEVTEGLVHLLDHPDASVEELMELIPGPDFPTGGFIYGRRGIAEAYRTGRGIIQLRARLITERDKRTGRERIVVTEIPFQVNKSRLLEKIADLVREKKIEGITDLRDESSKREGMRVVLELRRDEYADPIINQLYAHTQLQVSLGIIMLALVGNQPRVLTLLEVLQHFLEHRREVVIRRTRYEHRKALERAHLLEGLKKAVEALDAVLALIRAAASPDEARTGLIERFGLSEAQAKAILEMRLQRLTALERDKIVQEYQEVQALLADLLAILGSEERVRAIVREEILRIRDEYADTRKTEIVEETEDIAIEDMILEEDMVVTVSHSGYVKRNALSLYRSQRRGGQGSTAMETRPEDFVQHLYVASTHDHILFFTNVGRCHWLKVYEIPQAGRAARGKAIVNLLQLAQDERMTAMIPVRSVVEDLYLVMATAGGTVKKVSLSAFRYPRKGGILAISLDTGDELISVRQSQGDEVVFLGTQQGKAIRFREPEVRPVGRTARGVRGIRLAEGDRVVAAEVVRLGCSILTVTENGYGKRTLLEDYRETRRGGRGIIDIKTDERNGPVVGICPVQEQDEVMILTSAGKTIRIPVAGTSVIGRNTKGVRMIDLGEEDRVVSLARVPDHNGS